MVQISIEEAASILGITADEATNDSSQVKAAYKRLSLIHHPDKGGDGEDFKRVSAAYSRYR